MNINSIELASYNMVTLYLKINTACINSKYSPDDKIRVTLDNKKYIFDYYDFTN